MQTTTRNADLGDLVELLKDQHARKVDMVVPASKVRSDEGVLVVAGADPVITADGVTEGDGRYVPTTVCDDGMAQKLGVPPSYLKRLRAERPDLFDANVNGWLHGRKPKMAKKASVYNEGDWQAKYEEVRPGIPGDDRSFLLRAFRGDDGDGVARAFLSDRYAMMDNLDALTAALDGVRQSGAEVEITGADLSDKKMYVRVNAPSVMAYAPELLKDYRSPFTGQTGADNPVVSAGFVISNSEVGAGAFSIVPRITILVCKNGMTMSKDALRAVHLGGKMDEGVIRWSEDTERKTLELITAKARDAVTTFLDVEYMQSVVDSLQDQNGPVGKVDHVQTIGKRLNFDQTTIDGVLDQFIRGGDMTRFGVVQAITAHAQTVDDADLAYDLEANALNALLV